MLFTILGIALALAIVTVVILTGLPKRRPESEDPVQRHIDELEREANAARTGAEREAAAHKAQTDEQLRRIQDKAAAAQRANEEMIKKLRERDER